MHLLVIVIIRVHLHSKKRNTESTVAPESIFVLVSMNFIHPSHSAGIGEIQNWTLPHALSWERILLPCKANVRRTSRQSSTIYIYLAIPIACASP